MRVPMHRDKKLAPNLLELELQVVMSYPEWVLGIGLKWL